MAGYTHTTLSSALSSLALRLGDPDNVYWKSAELTAYIIEALRTWQAFTSFYRDRQVFNTAANEPFYDLSQTGLLPAGVFDYNVTDRNLVSIINYHLLEPQLSGGWTWTGTDQFSLAQVVEALQRRRDRFLGESGVVITKMDIATVVSLPSGRIAIPDTIIDIRRAAWMVTDPDDNTRTIGSQLWRDDEFSMQAFKSDWMETPDDPPQVYSVSLTPPASVQVGPIPSLGGELQVCAVKSGQPLDVTTGVLLGIPDDLAWGIKWGALADLLMADGQGTDLQRAQYCESRYQQAVALAVLNPAVLETQLNGVFLPNGSIFEMDAYLSSWQSTFERPQFAGMAGRNLMALGNRPDGVYSVTLDLARNMVVPSAAGDYLQVGREDLDTILDYAQHIAAFKEGGQDFTETMQLLQNFLKAAGEKNARLRQAAFYNDALRQAGLKQPGDVPRLDIPRTAQYESTITNSR